MTPKPASADPDARKGVRAGPDATAGVELSRFEFHQGDAIEWLAGYPFTGSELVYCDPPYVHSTRTNARQYKFEMTDAQHRALLQVIRKIPAPVMISGYTCKLYERELRDWRALSYQAPTRGGWMATEWLWMNYPEPIALHDYQYVGKDRRQRWNMERRRRRWVARLNRMPLVEARALLAAIEEAGMLEGPKPLRLGPAQR